MQKLEEQITKLEAELEAILFAVGEAVELERIAAAVGHDKETVRKVLCHMMDGYEKDERGIKLIELDGSFQLCTKPSLYEAVTRLVHVPKKQVLTDVLLETLSIIAYKQPITKLEIEAIRGVKSDHAVNKLVEYSLVCEMGRMEAPGRPIMFGTTEEFLRYFGIHSLDDLPIMDTEKIEDFKNEAEEEIQLKLDL